MMNTIIRKLYWLFAVQFGFNPRNFWRALRGIPAFVRDYTRFRGGYSGKMSFMPCLHDRYEEGGSTRNEYFWQDLLVARSINAAKPKKHVDVGSRVDGFVAHVASFREIEVMDIRPIETKIPGVVFRQCDLMVEDGNVALGEGYCDSLSCLHALEHFGLGRYGDPIDPTGHERGIANLARLLQTGGIFYLSVPVGFERVEFNANRVFDPRTIISAASLNGLILLRAHVIGSRGAVSHFESPSASLDFLAREHYNLAVFVFQKKQN